MTSDEARERMARRTGASPSSLGRDSAPVREARRLVRMGLKGALATLEVSTGYPYASLVAVATDVPGHPLLLLSTLALHARNLAGDPRASLLIDATSPTADPVAGGRITLVGKVEAAPEPAARDRFLARHPEATGYAGFADFSFHRLRLERGHFVGGFGRIVDIPAALLLAAPAAAAAIAAHEHDLVGELAPLAACIAARAGTPEEPWRLSGLDPDGVDLVAGGVAMRTAFGRPVETVEGLRAAVASLAAP